MMRFQFAYFNQQFYLHFLDFHPSILLYADTPQPPPCFKVPRLEEAPSVQRSIRAVALAFSITKIQQAEQNAVKKLSSKKKTSSTTDTTSSKKPKKDR
ncbi:hypothetical protein CAEBREN_14812 [Caenorhabditis brenneri]|uniref:Uncharacterized protein n=1 Tax=Caenorhabditis brenneri TaxID=135651 RepID=G0MN67_CAEBE|nr:hypothetical protein CAEBREN_14812 [Caenorhabditis brenneri]